MPVSRIPRMNSAFTDASFRRGTSPRAERVRDRQLNNIMSRRAPKPM